MAMRQAVLPFRIESVIITLPDGSTYSHVQFPEEFASAMEAAGAIIDGQLLPAKFVSPTGEPYHQYQGKDVRQMKPSVVIVE